MGSKHRHSPQASRVRGADWQGMGTGGSWSLLWVKVFRGPWAGKWPLRSRDRDIRVEGHRGKPKRDQESYYINLEFFLLLIKIINGEIW